MGQQQLLLLVLGVVLVGIAVVAGLSRFREVQRKDQFDRRMLYMVDLGSRIQAESRKPTALGGGPDTFMSQNGPNVMATLGAPIDTMYSVKHMGWKQPGLSCFMISFEGVRAHMHMLNPDTCERDSWQDYPWVLVFADRMVYREGPNFGQ